MAKILVSGLVNMETTCKVRRFPVEYYPIDYPFFGVQTGPSGVAYNIAKALSALGTEVRLLSMTGDDFQASFIRDQLERIGVDTAAVRPVLKQTPSSVVLYDDSGRRQVYCDLKDIQETAYPLSEDVLEGAQLAVCCNINFNRPLLRFAKAAGVKIATDVHVLGDLHDGYNKEFMENADILFLSDEAVGEDYRGFLRAIYHTYGNEIIVLGRGGKGTALCHGGQIFELPAVQVGPVVNTVGAGDALFTAFNHYYAKGYGPLEALIRAELFASNKIGASGGAVGFVDEKKIEEDHSRFRDEIISKQQVFPL